MSPPLLIVGPSWVGDMVMAQSLFKLLKAQQPERPIDVLAPGWSHPLLARMPEVREGIEMPVGHGSLQWGTRKALGRQLAEKNYAQAIVLPNSLKSALIPWFAKIPKRTGWLGEMRYGLLNDWRKLDKQKWPLMIQRFAALAFSPGHPVPEPESIPKPSFEIHSEDCQAALTRLGLMDEKPILGLCPGAEFGPAKRWPEQHYAQIARHYVDKGSQVWIFGSAKDSPVAEAIRQHLSEPVEVINLCGKTSLAEAIDLMSLCQMVVSNDSGLMHIAAALNKPLAVAYGSTSPSFTPPLSDRAKVVRLNLSCSPCFKRECPLGHLDCLNQLMPEQMLEAIDALERQLQEPPEANQT